MKCAAAFIGGLMGAAAGIALMPYVKPYVRKKAKMLKRTMHGMACKF